MVVASIPGCMALVAEVADQRLNVHRGGVWSAAGAAQDEAERYRRCQAADELREMRNALARAVRLTAHRSPPVARLTIRARKPARTPLPKV